MSSTLSSGGGGDQNNNLGGQFGESHAASESGNTFDNQSAEPNPNPSATSTNGDPAAA